MATAAKALTVSYDHIDDRHILSYISAIREGIDYSFFSKLVKNSSIAFSEWSSYLHISERTLQRYKKENRQFEALQSERILQIALLYQFGESVFGSSEHFNVWLGTTNISLGNIKPKELLDSSFGIDMLKDTLTRISHGVLS